MATKQLLEGALINGENQLRYGDLRQWDNVEATGTYRTNKKGQALIEVRDPSKGYDTRWLNTSSFTGVIKLTNNTIQHWKNGTHVMTQDITPEIKIKPDNPLELVRRYFNLTDRQFQIFTDKMSTPTKNEIIGVLKRVTH